MLEWQGGRVRGADGDAGAAVATTPVHFATNREEILKDGEVVDFAPRLNPKSPVYLRYGVAEMAKAAEPPPVYDVAQLGVAPEQIPGVNAAADAAPQLGSEAVFEGLRLRLIQNDADLVLLLHGYACTFQDALSNAAELKTLWSTKSKPLEAAVFSWPANGTLTPWLDYASDQALTISDTTKGNPDRLGATGPRTLTSLSHKVTSIDCSDVSETKPVTDARHQYYRKRPEVLADIRQVLAGKRPEDITGRDWIAARNCFRIRASRR